MKLTKEQTAENRRRIVQASIESIKARGANSVGLTEIIRTAGFTLGGFYNHFDSKDALVAAAVAAAFEHGVATVELVDGQGVAEDALHAPQHAAVRSSEIVHDHRLVPGLIQLDRSVRSDETRATGDDHLLHPTPLHSAASPSRILDC